jgi:ATP-binding cassette, subfamily B, multidrug efflux pump
VSEKNNQEQKNNSVPTIPGRPGPGGASRFGGPVVKPKDFKGTIKRLWSYFGKERKLLTVVFTIILIDSIIVLFAPFLIGQAVNAMSLEETVDFGLLQVTVITLLIAYITNALLNFSQGWVMAGVAGRIVKRLRSHLFKKLQKLPVSFFDSRTHGEMMSRLTNDRI